jgi:hypothetical protein
MHDNLEQQISEERARITTLGSALDSTRTPYLKSQLRFAGHMLDDAVSALRHAEKAQAYDSTMWLGFAVMNLQGATQRREKVQAVVEKYGGPANVTEIGA